MSLDDKLQDIALKYNPIFPQVDYKSVVINYCGHLRNYFSIVGHQYYGRESHLKVMAYHATKEEYKDRFEGEFSDTEPRGSLDGQIGFESRNT